MTILLNAVTKAATDAAAVYSQVLRVQSPPGAGAQYSKRTFQGKLALSTGGPTASTATILVQVSNDPVAETSPLTAAWLTLGTIVLSGSVSTTVNATDGFASDAAWVYVRASIAQNGITGTNAIATLIMGA